MSEERETLTARLMRAMSQMENPEKSTTATVPTKSGRSYTYDYETLAQVLAIVRPALIENGLALTQQQAWSENASSYVLRTIVFDEEEQLVMDERPLRDLPDPQAAGSWETYMRRYALRTAFGLCGEDDDGASSRAKAAVDGPLNGKCRACGAVYRFDSASQMSSSQCPSCGGRAFEAV